MRSSINFTYIKKISNDVRTLARCTSGYSRTCEFLFGLKNLILKFFYCYMASYSSSPEFRSDLRKLYVESYVLPVGFLSNYSSAPAEGVHGRDE